MVASMAQPALINIKSSDITAPLLELNNRHAKELSYLDAARFGALVDDAFLACRVGEAQALLLAFDQDAAYDSYNFLWFRERYERFVYVDRIVVDPQQRGRGLARALYAALFARARQAGHERIVCEINSDPPNPASDAFHQQLNFALVGAAELPGGTKRVRYFVKPLS